MTGDALKKNYRRAEKHQDLEDQVSNNSTKVRNSRGQTFAKWTVEIIAIRCNGTWRRFVLCHVT